MSARLPACPPALLPAGRVTDARLLPRTAAVLRALDSRDAPWVLILDELERARDPASVAILNSLLQHAPPNLHLALACRAVPRGLDAGGLLCAVALLAGKAGYSLDSVAPGRWHPSLSAVARRDLPMLKTVVETRLFTVEGGRAVPRHRHIAEFLGARYLAESRPSRRR